MFYYVAYMRDGSALTGFNHRRDTYGEALADGWSRVAGREGEVREMVVLRVSRGYDSAQPLEEE